MSISVCLCKQCNMIVKMDNYSTLLLQFCGNCIIVQSYNGANKFEQWCEEKTKERN